MKQFGTLILTVTFFACHQGKVKVDTSDTELDRLVYQADTTIITSIIPYDHLKNILESNYFSCKTDEPNTSLNNNGLKTYETFYYSDTSRKHLWLSIGMYNSNKNALTAFRNYVDFWACCIPDIDIVKLKNFEDITPFKNSSTTIYYFDNVVIYHGDTSDTIVKPIDQVIKGKKYLKLDIGNGGPAKWTIKR